MSPDSSPVPPDPRDASPDRGDAPPDSGAAAVNSRTAAADIEGAEPRAGGGTPALLLLALITCAALIIGSLARFKGLGRWPLAIDEYYFARSVQNILQSGWPQYACGGFYIRGMFLQYLAALLQLAGLSPELAPRLIAALSSLVALPAVFILGRRLGGRNVGLLAVAILAISIWEVEMARFGRMYAPFQAVFVWYLVCFLGYTVDRKDKALWSMLALSAFGVLVWEGGALLALTNLLAPLLRQSGGRLTRRDWAHLAMAALVFVPVYGFATLDLREIGTAALPLDYAPPADTPSLSRLDAGSPPWQTLPQHPFWAVAALLPLFAAGLAVPWIMQFRKRPLALLGLTAALVAALPQQFALSAAMILLVLLLNLVEWREIFARAALRYHAALATSVLFWISFGFGTRDWHAAQQSGWHLALLLGYEFVRFPDFVREVAIPWGRAVPILGLAILVLIAAACLRAIFRNTETPLAERALLVVLMCLLLAASASEPPRHETRYLFFLYPLGVLVALTTLARSVHFALGQTRAAAVAVILVTLGGFALTEDFKPYHLRDIDTERINFRIDMPPAEASHYHPRSDVRAAARWLEQHVARGRDIVINSFPGVDFYYPEADFYYMDTQDERFERWSCRHGTLERWDNQPLIHSGTALQSQIESGRKVWMVVEPDRLVQLRARLAENGALIQPILEWSSRRGDIWIVSFLRPAPAPPRRVLGVPSEAPVMEVTTNRRPPAGLAASFVTPQG